MADLLDEILAEEFAASDVDAVLAEEFAEEAPRGTTPTRVLQQLGRGATGAAGFIGDVIRKPFSLAQSAGESARQFVTGETDEQVAADRGALGRLLAAPTFGLTQEATEIIPLTGEEPTTGLGKSLERIANFLGGSVAPAAKVGKVRDLSPILASAVGGGLGQTVAEEVAPDSAGAQIAGALLGSLAPQAGTLVKAGLKGVSPALNEPERIARRLGATSARLNRGRAIRSSGDAVDTLLDVSPDFKSKIAGEANVKRLSTNVKGLTREAGSKIGDFFDANKKIAVSRDEVLNHPQIKELFRIAQKGTANQKRAAAPAVREIKSFLKDKGKISLQRLWNERQNLDGETFTSAGAVKASKDKFFQARDAFQDILETKVREGVEAGLVAPEAADGLLTANRSYGALKRIGDDIENLRSRTAGRNFIERLQDRLTLTELGTGALAGGVAGAAFGPEAAGTAALAAPLVLEALSSPELAAAAFRASEAVGPTQAAQIAGALLPASRQAIEIGAE